MEVNNYLSQSEKMSQEYCCCVVKIGEVKPIEKSDFLATTDVFGTQIVVRKDQVKEGDILVYAMNETEMNGDFLSVNNMYEIGCREKNSNADEVNAIMQDYEANYKSKAEPLRTKMKSYKKTVSSLTKSAAVMKSSIDKLTKKLEREQDENVIKEIKDKIASTEEQRDKNTASALALTTKIANLKNEVDEIVNSGKHIVDEAKKKVGFFNEYGRVRCITLQGEPSFGCLFRVEEIAKWKPGILDVNLESYLNQNFDTVDGELFVKAYVPRVKESTPRGDKNSKRNKAISRFDRMIEGQFYFHYDTTPLDTRVLTYNIKPTDKVVMSVKIHGTSGCFGRLLIKEPMEGFNGKVRQLWHNLTKRFNLPSLDCKYYNEKYGPVFTSRTVIKNRYINQNVDGGYYNADIWSVVGERLYPYIREGMTVYGEIFGYIGNAYIQKHYDYGCKPGEYKFMPYRITSTVNGEKFEWDVEDVRAWTLVTMKFSEEMQDLLHPIDILYSGTLEDLYPDLDTSAPEWSYEVHKKLANEKSFGMEENEPLCTNEVPREGFCLRIDGDKKNECFKLKTQAFKFKEAILVDSGDVSFDDNYQTETEDDEEK